MRQKEKISKCLTFDSSKPSGGPSAAQSGNQGEGKDQEDDQADDGKTTYQGRREPPGSGKQQTEDNGRLMEGYIL